MNDFEKKVLGYTVGSALIAAGIGTYINRKKQDKKRKLISSPQKSPNAIIVDVDANNFLRGLATPAELAASRGETPKEVANKAIEVANKSNKEPDTGRVPSVSIDNPVAMSKEDILAKKKAILSANARKFNFMGGVKKAEENADFGKTEDPTEPDKSILSKETEDIDIKYVDESNKSDNEDNTRVLPSRDEQGRFVSPKDTVAVNGVEKEAAAGNSKSWGEFLWNLAVHPIDTGSAFFERYNTVTKPLLYSLGVIGSATLASMLVDKVNEKRAKKSNNDVSKAREQYSRLLQSPESQEKDAAANEESKENTINTVLGGAFIVPAVLTAYIANKVMENRYKEEKKKKKFTNSIPNEPIILYRTVGTEKMASQTVEVAPEAILASLYATECFIKNAQAQQGPTYSPGPDVVRLWWSHINDGKMKQSGYDWLASPQADDFIRYIIGPGGKIRVPDSGVSGIAKNVIVNALDPAKVQNVFVRRAMNPRDPILGPIVEEARNARLDEMYKDWGLGKTGFGGWLRSIIDWFIKTFNIGSGTQEAEIKKRIGEEVREAFPGYKQQENGSAAAGGGNSGPFQSNSVNVAPEPNKIPSQSATGATPTSNQASSQATTRVALA